MVAEIVLIIDTSMETQSSKCQTWWFVGLIVNGWVVELAS